VTGHGRAIDVIEADHPRHMRIHSSEEELVEQRQREGRRIGRCRPGQHRRHRLLLVRGKSGDEARQRAAQRQQIGILLRRRARRVEPLAVQSALRLADVGRLQRRRGRRCRIGRAGPAGGPATPGQRRLKRREPAAPAVGIGRAPSGPSGPGLDSAGIHRRERDAACRPSVRPGGPHSKRAGGPSSRGGVTTVSPGGPTRR